MSDTHRLAREERLAASLRANLHRRKAQSRGQSQAQSPPADADKAPLPKGDPEG